MKRNGFVGRQMQAMAGSGWFRKVGPKVVPPTDRLLSKLTGGRVLMSSAMLPSLVLTTTGVKSGLPRKAPLATLPDDDGSFYVVGSNFGQEHHPAWTGNLIKQPAAEVTYRGRTFPVTAHHLTADEKQAMWPRLTANWPVYDRYIDSSGGRDLRVFHLVPTGS